MRKTILFSGGGTGGHLFPAVAMAEEIQKISPKTEIVFVGTKNKIEARVVPQLGYKFFTIWISGFHRRVRWSNIIFPIKVMVALWQSFFLLKKIRPNVVVGTGGYVCGPILYVASLLKIPTIVHESNSYPGVTTRMLAAKVLHVFITFDITRKWLSSKTKSVELVGNPTRGVLHNISLEEGRDFFHLEKNKKTILVVGGSLGATSINKAVMKNVEALTKNNIQIIWQTGENGFEEIYNTIQNSAVQIFKFIDAIQYAYAAADLVICRSGATTLAELTRLGKPAILVPYPQAAANHQELNAQAMVAEGAAIIVHDEDLEKELHEVIPNILFNEQLQKKMKSNSIKLGKPNAGKEIAEKILACC